MSKSTKKKVVVRPPAGNLRVTSHFAVRKKAAKKAAAKKPALKKPS